MSTRLLLIYFLRTKDILSFSLFFRHNYHLRCASDEVLLTDIYGHYLKEVSDRDVIDKLIQRIDLTMLENKLMSFLYILKSLAQVDAVSLLEIHQRISMIKNIPCEDNERRINNERLILYQLSNLSSFEMIWPSCERISTESDIDEQFEREI